MYGTLAILGAFAFVYSVAAGRLEKTPVNGPVVFLAFGILAGPYGLGLLDLNVSGEGLRTVAELTLALVLFTGLRQRRPGHPAAQLPHSTAACC